MWKISVVNMWSILNLIAWTFNSFLSFFPKKKTNIYHNLQPWFNTHRILTINDFSLPLLQFFKNGTNKIMSSVTRVYLTALVKLRSTWNRNPHISMEMKISDKMIAYSIIKGQNNCTRYTNKSCKKQNLKTKSKTEKSSK